ncbi:MAG: helix-turn-helix transcriptional regulator [Candidatus Liptonbacteria bacterium]
MRTHIEFFRKKLGLTQEELARRVNVARQTIISLEQGKYNPSLYLAFAVTKTLKKRYIEDLFELE